jgi:hypothetical protein
MGCDIHAWLETRRDSQWSTPDSKALDLDRAYDTFGLFFGVRNYANFSPVAERRGFPRGASALVCQDYEKWSDDAHSASWLTWADVERVEREQALLDSYIHEYDAAGTHLGTFAGSSQLTPPEYMALASGESVTKDGHLFRQEHVQALDNLSTAWQAALDRMRALAADYGADNVRLVVWFDN